MLRVMEPRARALLQSVSKADWRAQALPFRQSREVDIGYAIVRTTRLSYVGELGWELFVPTEFAVGVYKTLHAAGDARARRQADRVQFVGDRLQRAQALADRRAASARRHQPVRTD